MNKTIKMFRLAKPFIGSIVVGSILIASGCGGDDGSSTTSTTDQRAAGPTPEAICAHLPQAKVEELVSQVSGKPAPKLKRAATGTSKLVACRFTAPGVKLHVNVDTASRAARRYRNRVTELAQFGYTPQLSPHPVAGVGDPQAGGGANWIPSSDQLLTAAGSRYLIVDFYVRNIANGDLRDGAADLANLAFARLPGN